MIYDKSINYLRVRVKDLHNTADSVSSPTTKACALYHSMCVLGKGQGVSENHPAVKAAEELYQKAILEWRSGESIRAYNLLCAVSKLEEAIFGDQLL